MTATPGAPQDSARPPVRRHSRLRQWTVRIALMAVVLLLLTGASMDVLVTTSLPRDLVVRELERQWGLRVSAKRMATGWWGTTVLGDVSLSLPLSDDPLIEVPRVTITHNNRVWILLSRSVHIDSVTLDQPTLDIRQDITGHWNIAEAVALITRARSGGGEASKSSAAGASRLPAIVIQKGTADIVDRVGRRTKISPLDFTGQPNGQLTWDFTAGVPEVLLIKGRVAPSAGWSHQVSFDIQHLRNIVSPWVPAWPEVFHFAGTWRGQLAGDGISGQLDLSKGMIGTSASQDHAAISLAGMLNMQADSTSLNLQPRPLLAEVGADRMPVRITDGSLSMTRTRLSAQSLQLVLLGGAARLNGDYDMAALSGHIDAAWNDLSGPMNARHSGTLGASVSSPWPGQRQAELKLTSRGAMSAGSWDAQADLRGEGADWRRLAWNANWPRLLWQGSRVNLDLGGLAFRAEQDRTVVRLSALKVPHARQSDGAGEIDLGTSEWWAWMQLGQYAIPRLGPGDVQLSVSGARSRVDLSQFDLKASSLHMYAWGAYDGSLPKPLDVNLYMWNLPVAFTDPGNRLITGGNIRAEARAVGTLAPLDVALDGNLSGNDVLIGARRLGDMKAGLAGHLGPDQIMLESRQAKLFEGHWWFRAGYAFAGRTADVAINIAHVSMAHLDEIWASQLGIAGTLDARIRFNWPIDQVSPRAVTGDWTVRNLQKGLFLAEQVTGKLARQRDDLLLQDVEFRQGDGRARGTVRFDMRTRDHVSLENASGQNWPVEFPEHHLSMRVSGATKGITLDFARRAVTGPLEASVEATLHDKPLATIALKSDLQGRTIVVNTLQAGGFGGRVEGQASVVLDNWPISSGSLKWEGVDAARLVEMWPKAKGLAGTYGGSLSFGANTDPHATEPMAGSLMIQATGGQYRGMSVEGIDARLTAGPELGMRGPDGPGRPARLVIGQSRLNVAGGTASLWGRYTQHEQEPVVQAVLNATSLDLDQLVHALVPKAPFTPGRVSGNVTVYGPPRLYELGGNAQLALSQSSIIEPRIFGGIYSKLNPNAPLPPLEGTGSATLRLEHGTLSIPNLVYRNQGMWVHLMGQIDDLFIGGKSPISGYALGSTRPLQNINVPVISQLSDVLTNLQGAVLTFRISGTLKDRKLNQVTSLSGAS